VAPAVRAVALEPDGQSITLWADPNRTADELRRRSPRDAIAWLETDDRVRAFGRVLGELARTTPPDMRSPSFEDALSGLRLTRAFRGLGRRDAQQMLRVLPMSIDDFASDAFQGTGLRAVLAARAIQFTAMGPRSAGTTAVLLTDAAGNDGGLAGQTVFVRGGPGALVDALVGAVRSAGGEIRTSARVIRIISDDDVVSGVVLADGQELRAPIVVSGLDPKRTLLNLVDPVALGPSLRWRASNIRTPGMVAKVNLALRELPRFTGIDDPEVRLRGRIILTPGLTGIDRAHDAAKYGGIPEAPVLEATIPSLIDSSLIDAAARAGRDGRAPTAHVMSVIVQYAPYRLSDGDAGWDARRDELGDTVLRTIEAFAPGFSDLVTARQVITPLDLERDYGMTGGHPMHVEPGLESWFAWRPLLGHARYRLPLRGLYLCGSGTHPGGGVTGGPGENAAREILADRRAGR
jgi:phytoene dehydrogenase-like protein